MAADLCSCVATPQNIDELVKQAIRGHDLPAIYAEIDKIGFDTEAKRASDGLTLLHAAAKGGHDELAKRLLDHHARIEAKTSAGDTPLILAAAGSHILTVRLLLDHGADPTAKNSKGHTALDVAKMHAPESTSIIKQLESAAEKHAVASPSTVRTQSTFNWVDAPNAQRKTCTDNECTIC